MFKKAIVLDIISHPGLITDDVVNQLISDDSSLKLFNIKKPGFIKNLPANSIIAVFTNSKNIFIALPFFSSHLSLPLKVQEEVWIYEDLSASKEIEIEFYWVSRVHGSNFYEDLNYTYSDRKYLRSYTEENNKKNLNIPVALFNNGPVRADSNGKTDDNVMSAKEKRLSISLDLSHRHLLEDVPRTFKNPGDYIIQGSNNTLIRLGTNHIRKANNNFKESYNNTIFYKEPESYSGTIDLVAGRAVGSQDLSVDKNTVNYLKDQNVLFSNSITKKAYKNSQLVMYNEKGITENLKDTNFYLGNTNAINWAEGDPDFSTDISRLLISEYIDGDSLLNYSPLYSVENDGKQTTLNNKKSGFIIAKSDEIRLVARSNVVSKSHNKNNQLEGSNSISESGSIILLKEGGQEDRGYIAINSNGNIAVDGPAIVLGNKSREKENGKGDNIYLGNDAVEPGVLGYMLVNKLENFMDETIRALNIIGLCLKDLNSHVHPFIGPAGDTLPAKLLPNASSLLNSLAVDNTGFSDYTVDYQAAARSGAANDPDGNYGKIEGIIDTTTKLKDKIDGLALIRNSLQDVLSKMVKTL
jgi:hypothetical protein